MNSSTKKKIEFLQKYLQKRYKNWYGVDSDNIVGFRIGKKVTDGKKPRNYSIIFHVKKKKKESKLDPAKAIPRYLKIKFPDGKTRKIKTDVEETGVPKLQLGICKKPKKNGKIEVGTVGVILDDGINFFALTNYHVAARDRILNGEFFFDGQDDNIFVDGERALFVLGRLNSEIDAAFVQLATVPSIPNQLGDGTIIGGFSTGPLGPGIIGKRVVIYSKRLRKGEKSTIISNSSIFTTDTPGVNFEDVIQIRPRITEAGDSGGVALVDQDSLLGIVVGADNQSTYLIPYFKIDNFNPLSIA